MVTGNLTTEDSDSRLTGGRNKVKEGSTESRSLSTLPQVDDLQHGSEGSGKKCPAWNETPLS